MRPDRYDAREVVPDPRAWGKGNGGIVASYTPFTSNYSDISNDLGYQFEFFCDKCGSGHRSTFETNSVGVASSLLKVLIRLELTI